MEEASRARLLALRVKAVSKEAPGNKAVNVCDPDPRTAWSSGTTGKEWIILELEESCLLRELRIVNKSVAEWEISVSLAYRDKDTFTRAKGKCDAPRKEASYAFPFPACRFIRIFCFRGNPNSIFSVQAVGIPVPGLELESQPLIDLFTPLVTQPGSQADVALTAFREGARLGGAYAALLAVDLDPKRLDESLKFLSMLTSPNIYAPLLHAVRIVPDTALLLQQAQAHAQVEQVSVPDTSSLLSVSSNFAAPPVRRARATDSGEAHALLTPSALLALLRLTVNDASLAVVAKAVAGAVAYITSTSEPATTDADESRTRQVEGLLWVLMGCAVHPQMCKRLALLASLDLAPLLPLLRVLSPSLRPPHTHSNKASPETSPIDLAKNEPLTERVLALVYTLSSDVAYVALVSALKPVLLSGAVAQEQAGAMLLDLAVGPLCPVLPLIPARLHTLLDILMDCSQFLFSSSSLSASSRTHASRAPAVVLLLQMVATGALEEELTPLMSNKTSLLFVLSLLQHRFASAIISPSSSSSLTPQLRLFLRRAAEKCSMLPLLEEQLTAQRISMDAAVALLAPDLSSLSLLTTLSSPSPSTSSLNSSSPPSTWHCPVLAPPNACMPTPASSLPSSTASREAALVGDEVDAYLAHECHALRLSALPVRRAAAAEFEHLAQQIMTNANVSNSSNTSAVESLLLAAETLLNPLFLTNRNEPGDITEAADVSMRQYDVTSEWWREAEERRDETVVRLLLSAARCHHQAQQSQLQQMTSAEAPATALPVTVSTVPLTSAASAPVLPPEADIITRIRAEYDILFRFLTDYLSKAGVVLTEVTLHGLLLVLRASAQPPPPQALLRALMSLATSLHQQLLSVTSAGSRNSSGAHVARRMWVQVHALFLAASASEAELISVTHWLACGASLTPHDVPLVRYFVWLATVRAFRRASLTPLASLDAIAALLLILQDDLVAEEGNYHNVTAERVSGSTPMPMLYSLFPSLHEHMRDLANEAYVAAEEALALLPTSDACEALAWLTRVTARIAPASGPSARRWTAALPGLLCSLLKTHALVLASAIHTPLLLRLLLSVATNSSLPYSAIASFLAPLAPLFTLSTPDSHIRSAAADAFATQSLKVALSEKPSAALVVLTGRLVVLLSESVATSLIGPLMTAYTSAPTLHWTPASATDLFDAFTCFFVDALSLGQAVQQRLATDATDLLLSADQAAQLHAAHAEALCAAVAKCTVSASVWPQAATPLLDRLRSAQASSAGAVWAITGMYVAALVRYTPNVHTTVSAYEASLSALLTHRAMHAPRLSWRLSVLPIARSAWSPTMLDVALLACLVTHTEPEMRAGGLSWLMHATEPPNVLATTTVAALWPSLPPLARDALLYIRRDALALLQRLLPRLPPALLASAGGAQAVVGVCAALAQSHAPSDRAALLPLVASLVLCDSSYVPLIPTPLWSRLANLYTSPSDIPLLNALTTLCSASGPPDVATLQSALAAYPSRFVISADEATFPHAPLPTALANLASRLLLDHRKVTADAQIHQVRKERVLDLEASVAVLLSEGVVTSADVAPGNSPLETRLGALEALLESERVARRSGEARRRRAVEVQMAHEREAAWHRAMAEEQRAALALLHEREAQVGRDASRVAMLERERERTRELRAHADVDVERRLQRELEKRAPKAIARPLPKPAAPTDSDATAASSVDISRPLSPPVVHTEADGVGVSDEKRPRGGPRRGGDKRPARGHDRRAGLP